MRKTRRFLLVALLIAVVGFVSWLLLRPDPEPTYQGKPLSYWLDMDSSGRNADEAMRQIGTNAIPTLLRMLKAKDSKFKLMLMRLAQKQHLINVNWRPAWVQHYEALSGFSRLRSQGKSAVPALIEIYRERRSDPYNANRHDVAGIFAFIGPAAVDAVPQLVQDTGDTNSNIRLDAGFALGQIHARPDLAVPVLTKLLRDPVENVRVWAANGLAAFGSDAKSAVPDLVKAFADPSPTVREQAASALIRIDYDAAAKAGVK